MLFGLGTRRIGRVGTCRAFVLSIVVRTVAVARPGRSCGLRRGDRRRRRSQNFLRRLVLHL
jgi:hypothetical protein